MFTLKFVTPDMRGGDERENAVVSFSGKTLPEIDHYYSVDEFRVTIRTTKVGDLAADINALTGGQHCTNICLCPNEFVPSEFVSMAGKKDMPINFLFVIYRDGNNPWRFIVAPDASLYVMNDAGKTIHAYRCAS